MAEKDTVGEKFYAPVRISETVGGVLFWLGIPLSIAMFFISEPWVAVFIGKRFAELLSDGLQSLFLTLSVTLFVQGVMHRLYFLPRAEDARRTNILSNAFGVPLSHEVTIGYYNNDLSDPVPCLAANCMESAFFTKELARRMLAKTRTVSAVYLAIYLFLLLTRRVDLGMIELAAGVVFSEEVVARWLRLEFLRRRSEEAFERFRDIFAWNKSFWDDSRRAQVIKQFAFYETTKAVAAIPISSKVFKSFNPKLSSEWDEIRENCGF
ncbi:hypothetical protein [Roseovarius sp. M141]|uniref:hypothetical protein n=1 Tax=Roseovarius sp. M141 TaxID=2583806 RepID=UPI0020CF373D|nr:hypothetical protein [Roseovarius sp. M141]MCQ0091314.1 hypothetical protein [Roseovarius sp. M141]